ncbi:MAG TPA: phosphopentomutase [Trueperaceae bacterium]|nr:phosphopentomutase [Trueperaceae bacterium]
MTVTLVVLDSVGVGELPDAAAFGDAGSHTLDNVVRVGGAQLPNLVALGLGSVPGVSALPRAATPLASHGRLAELSPGKDTTTGHWEFMGVVLEHPFRTFTAFPPAVMDAFDAATGRGHLGNRPASGTVVLDELGEEHLRTGFPIVYTSADSVFQVATHVDVVPLQTLYDWCQAARSILVGENSVARVIARPFTGRPGAFERLGAQRHDYSVAPPHPTVLDELLAAGREVVGVGKIPDIYAHRGFTREVAAGTNALGIDRTVELMLERPAGLVMTNLVEFDSLYGHRRDPHGYARALEYLDGRLPELLAACVDGDVLMFVSDHGNDPTWTGTDHTREHGLLLAYAPGRAGVDLGTRSSFADVGATVAELLRVDWRGVGESFARVLVDH